MVKDSPILYEARQVAIKLLEEDPGLAHPKHGTIKKRFLQLQKSSGIWSNIS